jgi:hypothetical protein
MPITEERRFVSLQLYLVNLPYFLTSIQLEQKIGIFLMKCVGYNEAFQQTIADNFRTWNDPQQAADD